MKYLITESQIENLILNYIGELRKVEESLPLRGQIFIWVNDENTPIFKYKTDVEKFYINKDFFSQLQKIFSISVGDIFDIAQTFSLKLTGKPTDNINLF